MNKKRPPVGSQSHNINSTSLNAQRQRLLDALNAASTQGMTTIQIRERLDIMMPAARVHELRWSHGYNISLLWSHDENAQGNRHSCARYVLLPGTWKQPEGTL
ncbi:MAG: helix-turn-helix domain-containing protein [Alcanivoracaceae bacterium]|nr:helix-turn-helix domain-containing protein [Alcanivoracaceae bacterium]